MKRAVKHAANGVLAWRTRTSFHTGTHMVAPLHAVQKTRDLASIPPETLFGNGIVLDIPRADTKYATITEADLKAAGTINEGDIVVINTGWHKWYDDALKYYGEAPGLTECAAKYLVSKKVKFVAMDTPFIDHPLATSMAPHRGGPQMKRLAGEYNAATGKDWKVEHGKWYVAMKTLAAAEIPMVLQVGGDVDDLKGKRATFAATPWRLERGDACIVRMVAMIDPSGKLKLDEGKGV
jgi:kynurenine formamidase